VLIAEAVRTITWLDYAQAVTAVGALVTAAGVTQLGTRVASVPIQAERDG